MELLRKVTSVVATVSMFAGPVAPVDGGDFIKQNPAEVISEIEASKTLGQQCVENYMQVSQPDAEAESLETAFEQAIDLAHASGDIEAIETANFLEDEVEYKRNGDLSKVELYELNPEMEYQCEPLIRISGRKVFGVYNEEADAIVLNLKGEQVSTFNKALVIFHEGYHAGLGKTDVANEEIKARMLEQRLASFYYGQKYENLVASLEKKFQEMGYTAGHNYDVNPVDADRFLMKEAFGPSLSATNHALNYGIVWTDALFELVAQRGVKEGWSPERIAEEQEAAFESLLVS